MTIVAHMTLRFASKNGRAQLVVGPKNNLVDLAEVSGGRFDSDPIKAFPRWSELREFAATITDGGMPANVDELDAPSPWPLQVFAIGLNYRSHAEESGMGLPAVPLTFTKFTSCIAAPNADIPIDAPMVDWEVELVVVMSSGGRNI